eukprot:CAMPEP_0171211104 /NCGR_PEP_ID=MMETSP0790-20130122/29451_1 /TAXON_ID=2925 /ORGANISM="Alexandrium catenella, Strain OF101" /LENGTH=223 /DNA_ID=CAMNT_0011676759 /DNA_START=60 /DNA_END=732 /DNA_ORIENTATION=-
MHTNAQLPALVGVGTSRGGLLALMMSSFVAFSVVEFHPKSQEQPTCPRPQGNLGLWTYLYADMSLSRGSRNMAITVRKSPSVTFRGIGACLGSHPGVQRHLIWLAVKLVPVLGACSHQTVLLHRPGSCLFGVVSQGHSTSAHVSAPSSSRLILLPGGGVPGLGPDSALSSSRGFGSNNIEKAEQRRAELTKGRAQAGQNGLSLACGRVGLVSGYVRPAASSEI